MTAHAAIAALVVLFVGSIILLAWVLIRDAWWDRRHPDEAQRIDDLHEQAEIGRSITVQTFHEDPGHWYVMCGLCAALYVMSDEAMAGETRRNHIEFHLTEQMKQAFEPINKEQP